MDTIEYIIIDFAIIMLSLGIYLTITELRLLPHKCGLPRYISREGECLSDIDKLFKKTSCSAAAAGSLFVYQKKGMGVLINFPYQTKNTNK